MTHARTHSRKHARTQWAPIVCVVRLANLILEDDLVLGHVGPEDPAAVGAVAEHRTRVCQ